MIYVAHGIVEQCDPLRIGHALMLSRQSFTAFLQSRRTPFVSIEQAVAGHGDALTVDDATMAAFEQVSLARQHGHAVTWFVNGENVANGDPYFPFLISWMIDETRLSECFFEGQWWPLNDLTQRKSFRLHLKRLYMRFSLREQVLAMLESLRIALEFDPAFDMRELRTARQADLERAAGAGVDLRNHGWTHLNPLALDRKCCEQELDQNQQWLACLQPGAATVYAPPYGAFVPLRREAYSLMLLADPSQSVHTVNQYLVNRQQLPERLRAFPDSMPHNLHGIPTLHA